VNDQEYSVYLEERKLLIDAEREAARSLDKALITLSSGAIVLSIAFIKDTKAPYSGACLLFFAWAVFIGSLLSVVVSFLLSQLAMRRQRDIVEASLDEVKGDQKNAYVSWILWLNGVSIALLTLGIMAFALFVGLNIPRSAGNVAN
jgi:hypothetical protein